MAQARALYQSQNPDLDDADVPFFDCKTTVSAFSDITRIDSAASAATLVSRVSDGAGVGDYDDDDDDDGASRSGVESVRSGGGGGSSGGSSGASTNSSAVVVRVNVAGGGASTTSSRSAKSSNNHSNSNDNSNSNINSNSSNKTATPNVHQTSKARCRRLRQVAVRGPRRLDIAQAASVGLRRRWGWGCWFGVATRIGGAGTTTVQGRPCSTSPPRANNGHA